MRRARDPSLPPGPTEPSLLQAYRYTQDPTGFLDDCAARFGPCFTLRMPFLPASVVVASPEGVRDVFSAPVDVALAGEANSPVDFMIGRHALMRLDGARHARERRLINPAFHGDRLNAYAGVIEDIARSTIARWSRAGTVSLFDEMRDVSLRVILEFVFGLKSQARQEELRRLLLQFRSESMTPLMALLWLVVPGSRLRSWMSTRLAPYADRISRPHLPGLSLARCIRDLDRLLYQEIENRRRGDLGQRNDVLTSLVAARDEEGRGLADEEIRDEVMGLLIGGYETTASALAWSTYEIFSRPELLVELRREAGEAFVDGRLAADRVAQLKILDATVRETMRFHSSVVWIARKLAAPARIGAYDLPAGIFVAPAIYLMHRNREVWPDPDRFDPGRFVRRKPKPSEFIQFGGGARTCIGMALAMLEAKIVLANVLRTTSLRIVPGPAPRTVLQGLVLGPSRPIHAVVERPSN